MAPFTGLPSEVLSLIVDSFSQRDLYTFTLINKQCYLAFNSLLWQFRQLPDGDTVDTILKKAVIVRHPQGAIKRLKLYYEYWTDTRLFVLVESGLDRLEELHLINTPELTDRGLVYLARRSPNLEQLYLSSVDNISQRTMDAIGYYCTKLTKLDVYDCQGLGGDTYAALQHCPLQTLHVALLPHLLESEMAMWDLIVYCPHLVDLKLDLFPQFMTNLLEQATGAWPNLTTFALTNYMAFPDDPLIDFLSHHLNLRQLYLRKARFEGTLLDQFAALCLPSLESLVITDTRLNSNTIRQLVHTCPSLTYIEFWGCKVSPYDFPEVGVRVETPCNSRLHCHYYHFLHHLDQEDMDKVRLGLR